MCQNEKNNVFLISLTNSLALRLLLENVNTKGSLHLSGSPSQEYLLSNMTRIAMDLVPIVFVVPGSQPGSQLNSNTF